VDGLGRGGPQTVHVGVIEYIKEVFQAADTNKGAAVSS
jgi:hypothetical protein